MSYWNDLVEMAVLEGQTITKVEGLEEHSEEVFIHTKEGNIYKFYHEQDCCESVYLSDFEGDSSDLIGGLIVKAEEVSESGDEESENKPYEYCESFTWTFYKIDTTKGSLWMRWLGESNGYYSESVYIVKVN